MEVSTAAVRDIYEASSAPRDVITLAAEVREGNSGGPLLTLDGQVAGVVFARDGADDQIGYAMAFSEFAPVAGATAALTAPVSTGACLG